MPELAEVLDIERLALPNGLRVVVDRHERLGTAAITVLYGVGGAWDRPGESGLAHVVEHLMFQGSANFGALSHFTSVQGMGGQVNGQTHLDFTEYYEEIPSEGVEHILAMEADRMKGFVVSQESYLRELEVVKEEVLTGQNHPYRSFPWRWLAPLMFEGLPDGYDPGGRLADIDSLTLRRAEEFFAENYTPANAVLVISGELDEPVSGTIHRLFGEIAPGRVPPVRPIEIDPNASGHHGIVEPSVPLPACAVVRRAGAGAGLRLDTALDVLAAALNMSLNDRLKASAASESRLRVSFGMYGEGANCLSPPMLAVSGIAPGIDAGRLAELLQEELEDVAAGRIAPNTLEALRRQERIMWHQVLDSPLMRSRQLAYAEFLRNDAASVFEKATILRTLSAEDLAEAARVLLSQPTLSMELANDEGDR